MSEKVTIKVERKKLHLPTIALRGLVIGGMEVYMHRGNMKRLICGTENKFSVHHKKSEE